jgi:hypothetical protein
MRYLRATRGEGMSNQALKAISRHHLIPDTEDKQKFTITQKIEELVKQILELRNV